jgi:hypothetical protein
VQTTISSANILDAVLLSMERLTGAELVAHHKNFSSNKQAAEAAGYVKVLPDGRRRVQLAKYRDALLVAAGISPAGDSAEGGRKGKPLSYATRVLKPGHAVLGAAYLAEAGLEAGDALQIKVARGRITLSAA